MNAPLPRRIAGSLSKHIVLLAMAILLGFPLVWMILSSLKTDQQALAIPTVWIPHPFLWHNYKDMLDAVDFVRYVLNTLMYAAVTIVGVCLSGSLVAYGFSRLQWKGRDVLFKIMVSTLLVPTFVGSSIFSTFLLRQFFMTIPMSVSDAARVDGANEFTIFARIILPMSKPALASVILFQFVYCWNDYLGPLVYLSDQKWYPLALGLTQVFGTYSTNWPWVMAAATLATLPIVVLFFFTQRTFLGGIAIQGTGEKG